MMFDVVILGAGVAGMAAASVLAKKGLKVALVDQAHEGTVKMGECLMADALPILDKLNLKDDFIAAKHRKLHAYNVDWGDESSFERHLITNPMGAGWLLDRAKFDRGLQQQCRDVNVVFYWQSRFEAITRLPNSGWRVAVKSDQVNVLDAMFVVDASGRSRAMIRKLKVKQQSADKMVAVCCHIKITSDVNSGIAHISNDVHGWWYLAKFNSTTASLCYFTDADLITPHNAEQFIDMAKKKSSIKDLLIDAIQINDTYRRCSANTSALQQSVGDGWLALGDAAVSFDPLSSYGITSALSSAFYGSQAILRSFSGQSEYLLTYQSLIRRNFIDYLVKRQQEYNKLRHLPSLFWQRRKITNNEISVTYN